MGEGFGSEPAPTNVAAAGYTGDDYGNSLYFCDNSTTGTSFCAGQNNPRGNGFDVIGLVVESYSDRVISFALGSNYARYYSNGPYALRVGDNFSIHVSGAICSGELDFPPAPPPGTVSTGGVIRKCIAGVENSTAVNPDEPPTQVVFVHGIRAGCDEPGANGKDYASLYDTLAGQGLGVYTFCYDHDLAFSRTNLKPTRCFSDTSRGESTPKALTVPLDGNVGPLAASEDAAAAQNDPHEPDSTGPLAYDATKLDDCLKALISYDIGARGHPEAIAVIGNSMGGAITRGWLELAQARQSQALDAVTTVIFLEGATQGSWFAGAGKTVETLLQASSLSGPEQWVVAQILTQIVQRATDSAHVGLDRPGVQDLVPESSWYSAIAKGPPPPHLHYFTFSTDITLKLEIKELFWSLHTFSTDFLGDGLLQLGEKAADAEPAGGGSQFLPFGSGPDQHQYILPTPAGITYDLGSIGVDPISFAISAPQVVSAAARAVALVYTENPYAHFKFGAHIGTDKVQSCDSSLGMSTIPEEINHILSNPAQACSGS